MIRLRRITALLVGLVSLPSALAAGGDGCLIDAVVPAKGAVVALRDGHAAHEHAYAAQSAAQHPQGHDVLSDTDTDSAPSVPDAPTQCILSVGCGALVMATADTSIDGSPKVVGRVEAARVLAPDSPTPGLEPPPPRA